MADGVRDQLKSILAFHPSIRYAILVGKDGTPKETVGREAVESLEPHEATMLILKRFAIGSGMTAGSERYFGKMLTLMVRREKLIELLFPLADHMVLVSADTTFPLERVSQLEGLVHGLPPGETS